VLHGGPSALGERGGDDGAVALGGVTLVAEERHRTVESGREVIEQRSLGSEVLAEIGEVPSEVTIVAQPMPNMPGRSEGALMLVRNPRGGQRG